MKKKIALITGGYSSEYQISLNSSGQIARALDPEKYEVYTLLVTRDKWLYIPAQGEPSKVDLNDFSIATEGRRTGFDAAFVAIHGAPGEDGQLEGYLDMMDIPYTCSGRLVSALTFNKIACKQYLAPFGILSAGTISLHKGQDYDPETLVREVGLPCFVKPNEGGSSFGTSRVNRAEDLPSAIEAAFAEDRVALVETFIPGTEITCGLMKTPDREIILPLTEIVSKKEFFDFEAKYTSGMADEIVPARVPDDVTRHCQELSSEIYSLLDCRGLVRIDYILNGDKLYFLEVNTVPGMSAESIVPKMMKQAGIKPGDMFGWMIDDCIWRKKSS